jgi:ribonuclease J
MAALQITFLGGLGEIGRNCFCIDVDGKIVVVDVGIMFPDPDMPGVDLVLPDFTYLKDRADDVAGIVLTHAHEDHAGGLAYLLRDVSAPIYGSALSLGLARRRIEEARLMGQTELIPVTDGETRRIGNLEAEFVPITHSVPWAFAVAYHTPAGTILHSGDFKIDHHPVDGRLSDLARLGEIGTRNGGVRMLLSDSTNAERPGTTGSESSVGPVFHDLMDKYPTKRFVVACFASHLHRVQQIADAAVAKNRKVALLGRSMVHNMAVGRELGVLNLSDRSLIEVEDINNHAPGDVCVICTGSQGEPMSALSLMAAHEHKLLTAGEDDVVVISAHAIPGNEASVARVIDSLVRAGAKVIHGERAGVHVSGHGSADELSELIELAHPDWFVPVHGEYRHMVAHGELAVDAGVAPDHVLICEDGDRLKFAEKKVTVERRAVPAGYVYVDGLLDDVGQEVLRDRKNLGEEGFVAVIITVDSRSGEVVTGPDIVTRGWVYEAEANELIEEAKDAVRASIAEAAAEGALDVETMRRHARRSLGRFINQRTRRRPGIIPVIIEV